MTGSTRGFAVAASLVAPEKCPNGVPYYLQHQVWKPEHDPRGLGGDQLSMALSSWNLLHGYLGDPAVASSTAS
jgi:hypothetical protein